MLNQWTGWSRQRKGNFIVIMKWHDTGGTRVWIASHVKSILKMNKNPRQIFNSNWLFWNSKYTEPLNIEHVTDLLRFQFKKKKKQIQNLFVASSQFSPVCSWQCFALFQTVNCWKSICWKCFVFTHHPLFKQKQTLS